MNQTTKDRIRGTFDLYRGFILAVCEQQYGDTDNWPFVRSNLLKLLSDQRGLEAKITEILLSEVFHEL